MSVRFARPMRVLGFAIGVVLLLLAIAVVWRGRQTVGTALDAATPLEVPRVIALAACVVVNLILSGLFFSVLVARYQPVEEVLCRRERGQIRQVPGVHGRTPTQSQEADRRRIQGRYVEIRPRSPQGCRRQCAWTRRDGGSGPLAAKMTSSTGCYGRVGLVEMQAMIATSSLMNFLPLRPGLFGRLAWHRAMHGIQLADSARMVVEGAVVSGGAALVIGAAVLGSALVGLPAILAFALVVAMIAITFAASAVLGARGVARLALAALIRSADAAVWAMRYHLAFSLIGAPVRPGAAIAFACAGMLAGLVPIIGNGLGVREWAIGLLAPLFTTSALALGVTAELVNRAVETLVIVVAGSAGAIYLAWRRSAARAGAQGAGAGPAAARSSSTAKSDSNG